MKIYNKKSVIFFLLATLFAVSLPFSGYVQKLENRFLDLQFEMMRKAYPRSVENDIVLVGIDEETVEKYREPMLLWHRYLGDFLEAMAYAEPSVVGLDVMLPGRSYDFLLEGQDRLLLSGLSSLRKVAPIVLGRNIRSDGTVGSIYPPFLSVAGYDASALAIWRTDEDGVVRRFSENLGADDQHVDTLTGVMARKLGIEVEEGVVDFSLGEPFNYYPFHEVIERYRSGDQAALKSEFSGRPILLGVVLPDDDRHLLPVDLTVWEGDERVAQPGFIMHAQMLRSQMNDAMIAQLPVVTSVLICFVFACYWWFSFKARSSFFVAIVLAGTLAGLAFYFLAQGYHVPVIAPIIALFAANGGRITYELTEKAVERRRLKNAFSGSVSPAVMQRMLAGELEQTERHRVCMLFSDIRGFTSRSEKMAPEEVVRFLNEYFEKMTAPVHSHGGTLDKFMGDGIMAFFGAPNRLENPCKNAFAAAQDMVRALDCFNEELIKRGVEPVKIGIGLHVGDVVIGCVGSSTRQNYTAVGDVVNTSSRLESLTKELCHTVVCSSEVYNDLGCPEEFNDLGEVSIRGRSALHLWGWSCKESPVEV